MSINLDEITKALAEATPGPWECDERVGCISVHPKQDANCICDVTDQVAYWNGFMEDGCWNVKESDSKNAYLIAHAPEWLRLLVERVRKLESSLEEISIGAVSKWSGCEDQVVIEPLSADDMIEIANDALDKEST